LRLIYSISTTPSRAFLKDKLAKQILIWKKSITLAKKFYPITLWTDEVGAAILGDLVDEVKILKKDTENYLWCEPKYEAMMGEDISNSIFIDGDVFLAEPLKFSPDKDIWFEHLEKNTFQYTYQKAISCFDVSDISSKHRFWHPSLFGACNVGILRFSSDEVMKSFRDTFYILKDHYFKNVVQNTPMKVPEMVMEEYGLSCLIEYNSWTWEALNEQNSYVHMCGSEKYKAGFLKLIS